MSSIIPNYNFDIYVSYRYNDAIFEWVQEFIVNLEHELAAILRDKLTVHFNVKGISSELDEEEAEKVIAQNLKTLIFIPIISHGYCDVKKFYWKKEFMKFKELALSDNFGLNIPIKSGYSLSRIIPVRINEINRDELLLLEQEVGDYMRSVDFIYDTLEGVNRPLRFKDDDMLFRKNTSLYRNQINKTANVISEIIKGIQASLALRNNNQSVIKNGIKDEADIANNKQNTVFLSWAFADCVKKRDDLFLILQKAGLNVIPINDCPLEDHTFMQKVTAALSNSCCSVHILGSKTGRLLQNDNTTSLTMYQFNEVKNKLIIKGSGYKQFIWYCPQEFTKTVDPEQQNFINFIRNNLTSNMVFTTVTSPMQLVDDIRASLAVKQKQVYNVNETDVVLINNQLDEQDAKDAAYLLTDIMKIETLTISQDADIDYAELSVQQIKKSKLAVVYFKEASDWALSFTQQIWKLIGGASSLTPILFIGDKTIEKNLTIKFNAPKVISLMSLKELLPLEIKAIFDKVTGENKDVKI